MKPPPDICGFRPTKIERQDRRWIAVRNLGTSVSVPAPGRFSKAQKLVNSTISYARETVDYWATPDETWLRKKGDCEDFALLKRAILKASGIPDDDLFFVLAWDSARREQHAFLIARQGDKAYVLDVPGGLKTMYPVGEARDFQPHFAFTGTSAWGYAR